MRIRIKFGGGPLDGMESLTQSLPELKIFFPPRDRLVLVYRRVDELKYGFSAELSRDLTTIYDAAREKFGQAGPGVEQWEPGEDDEDYSEPDFT